MSTFLQSKRYITKLSLMIFAIVNMQLQILAYAEELNDSPKVHYTIPAGPLGKALSQFAGKNGLTFSFDPKVVEGKQTSGLNGEYSINEGFNKLLDGSGLAIGVDLKGGYYLQKATLKESGKPVKDVEIELKKTVVRANRFKNVGPLPGLALTKEQIAGNIQSITAKEIKEAHSLSLSDLLNSKLQSVNVNDYQGNPFQMDLTYRGFTASPQIGTPQGLSIFFDSIRVNEPFGDVVNWDLIPMNALDSFDIFPGSNPLFGLNTLGGALSMKTKSGFTSPDVSAEILAGSYGRRQLQASGGWNNANKEQGSWDGGEFAAFAAVNLFLEDGWRDNSPTEVNQAFGKVEWQGERASLALSSLAAVNKLVGNGTVPQEIYRQDAASVFTSPDETNNKLLQFQIAGAFDVTDNFSVTGQVYQRNSNRYSETGDIIDQETFSNADKSYNYWQTRLPGQGKGLQCAFADSDANGIPDFYMISETDYVTFANKYAISGVYDMTMLQFNPSLVPEAEKDFKAAFAKGLWDVFISLDTEPTASLPVGAAPSLFMQFGSGIPYSDGVQTYYIWAADPINKDTCRSIQYWNQGMLSNKLDASNPPTLDDIPLDRDGAIINTGRFGSGVVEGTPTAVITKSNIEQRGKGAAVQLNWNYDEHKFMVGASIDKSAASYVGKQRLALLDDKRNVFSDPSKLGEEFWAGSNDVTINDFDGESLTKSLYFSETWSPSQTLNFSVSGRYNDTHVVNKLAPTQAERRLEDLRWINRYVFGVICPGTTTANCPYNLDGPIPADVYWNQLFSLSDKELFTTNMLDKAATEKFSFYSFNPSVGVTWQTKPNLNLYANWNQGTRAPSVIELGCAYDDTLVGVEGHKVPRSLADGRGCKLPSSLSGDPFLPQVVARTMEVGARGKFNEFMEWNVSAYRTDVKDDIYMTSVTSELNFFQSIGDTRRQGIEFGLAGEYGKSDFRINYSLTEATFESFFKTVSPNNSSRGLNPGLPDYNMIQVHPGNVMPGVPFNNFNFNWGYKLTPKLKMNWGVVAHSRSFLRGNENNDHTPSPSREVTYLNSVTIKTPANNYSGTAPGFAVVNFNAHYDLGKGWGVGALVNNVLDKKYYTAGRLGTNPFAPANLGAIGPGGFNYNSSEWISSQFISAGAPRGIWLSLGYDFDASKKAELPPSDNTPEPDRTLEPSSELPSAEELALMKHLDKMKSLPVIKQLRTAKQEVSDAVAQWRKQLLENNADGYVQQYASTYAPDGMSHQQWVEQQKFAFTTEPVAAADVSNIVITPRDQQFIAIFTHAITKGQKYQALRKVMTFENKNGQWVIVRERSLPTSRVMALPKAEVSKVHVNAGNTSLNDREPNIQVDTTKTLKKPKTKKLNTAMPQLTPRKQAQVEVKS